VELEQRRGKDPVGGDITAVERAIADVERKRRNLASNLALVDADTAALLRDQLASWSAQRQSLGAEREQLLGLRQTWQAQQDRLDNVEAWCRTVATYREAFTYRNKRDALEAFDVVATVWRAGHEPRFEISLDPERPVESSTRKELRVQHPVHRPARDGGVDP
jgi:hypothetical protein